MPGVCGALVCEFACGLDVQLPHQPVDPLSGADHFPPDHVPVQRLAAADAG